MGRPRKHNTELPPCVYLRGGKYRLVKSGKWTTIGGERELSAYKLQLLEAPDRGMGAIIDAALAHVTKGLASSTKTQYEVAAGKLKYAFHDYAPEEIHGRQIKALKRGMAEIPNMFNRCLTVLRHAFDHALDEESVDDNPAMGVRRYREATRKRLLSPEEFERIYAQAVPRLQCMMDLWRLTGQRVMDVVKIRVRDLGPDGIAFAQQKTDERLVVRWTPELKATVDRAKSLNGNVRSMSLFSARKGKNRGGPPSYRTVTVQWVTACDRAAVGDAQARDLRAVAATTAKRQGLNPQALLGHTNPQTTVRYLRDKEVPMVDAPTYASKTRR